MALVNTERILNEVPQKRLLILYNGLKENYTEEKAGEYYEFYHKQPLSFIIENSRYIFGEEKYGLPFYESLIQNPNLCLFNEYYSEREKVKDYITELQEKHADSESLVKAHELKETLTEACMKTHDIIVVAGYGRDVDIEADYGKEISDKVYEYTLGKPVMKDLQMLLESVPAPVFFTYAPFVVNETHETRLLNNRLSTLYLERTDEEGYREYATDVALVSKLSQSVTYQEAVKHLQNRDARYILESLAESDLRTFAESLSIRKIPGFDPEYTSPVKAVNDLFDEMFEAADESKQLIKDNLHVMEKAVYEPLFDLLVYEHSMTDDTSKLIKGYNFFKEGTTLEDAMVEISRKYMDCSNELTTTYTEAEEEPEGEQKNEKLEEIKNDEPQVPIDGTYKKDDASSKK